MFGRAFISKSNSLTRGAETGLELWSSPNHSSSFFHITLPRAAFFSIFSYHFTRAAFFSSRVEIQL